MKRKISKTREKQRVRVVKRELNRIFEGKLSTPLNYSSDIELLVAVMLSAQSTDKGVNELTKTLFKKYRSAKSYAKARPENLERDLSRVNYYRTKARNIQKTMVIINQDYKGHVPETMKELLELPGVGRKTANVILGHLYGIVEGIAVDTHVLRLSKKFGLVTSDKPLEVEKELMRLLPQKDWWDFSYKIKAYGREISPARRGYDDPISLTLIKQKLLDVKVAKKPRRNKSI